MHDRIDHLRLLHQLLARRAFYQLALSSLLACALLAARIYLSHSRSYIFLVWNLFLAWVPYLASLWAAGLRARHPARSWRLALPAALWLLFFPNAPYIITDFIHLHEIPSMPLWYDIGLLATFAWTGCFLAVASLQIMQALVATLAGRVGSWLFVLGTIGLSGLGIYMGRFMGWNSWDLLLNPREVVADLIERLSSPLGRPQPLGVTLMFAAFLLVCYVTFTSVAWRSPARRRL